MRMDTFKAIYVYGDDGLWRLGKTALRKIARGADWIEVATPLAASYNYRTGRWSKLPEALCQSRPWEGLWSWHRGCEVFSYDEQDEIKEIAETLMGWD